MADFDDLSTAYTSDFDDDAADMPGCLVFAENLPLEFMIAIASLLQDVQQGYQKDTTLDENDKQKQKNHNGNYSSVTSDHGKIEGTDLPSSRYRVVGLIDKRDKGNSSSAATKVSIAGH